jgi:hypothetical protein
VLKLKETAFSLPLLYPSGTLLPTEALPVIRQTFLKAPVLGARRCLRLSFLKSGTAKHTQAPGTIQEELS